MDAFESVRREAVKRRLMTGRFGRKLLLVSIEDVDRVDPDERRIILTDPPQLLSE
jgi:hypothetical protein